MEELDIVDDENRRDVVVEELANIVENEPSPGEDFLNYNSDNEDFEELEDSVHGEPPQPILIPPNKGKQRKMKA